MPIAFAPSPRSTLGLEWELALVDHKSRELVSIAPEILEKLRLLHPPDRFPHFAGELLQNTVEIVSAPHSRVRSAIDDLRRLGLAAAEHSHRLDAALIGSGSHPFSHWSDQQITESERYDRFVEKYRWWGRNMLIWGVHMHVGVDRQDRVIPLMHALLTYLPHLLALSASSPFWAAESTGYASNRTLRFQQLPTAGLPWEVEDWSGVERVLDDLTKTGTITEPTEARWDIRPAPQWGTIEVRFCDGASTLTDIGALAALTQCLTEYFQQCLDRGEALPRLQPWYVRENKWRAARYGLDAVIITTPSGQQGPLREEIRNLLLRLEPVAAALDCESELTHVARLLTEGTSSERQLRVFERFGGEPAGSSSLIAVVDSLIDEFTRGLVGNERVNEQ